jgi:hypothetical protein
MLLVQKKIGAKPEIFPKSKTFFSQIMGAFDLKVFSNLDYKG